jgi:hypothetical protein
MESKLVKLINYSLGQVLHFFPALMNNYKGNKMNISKTNKIIKKYNNNPNEKLGKDIELLVMTSEYLLIDEEGLPSWEIEGIADVPPNIAWNIQHDLGYFIDDEYYFFNNGEEFEIKNDPKPIMQEFEEWVNNNCH